MRRMLIGMSQEKLGEQLGLTFQQIQKYEKGSNRVSASRLYQMAQILGVPVQFFFDDMPPEPASPDDSHGFSEGSPQVAVMGFLNSAEGIQLNRAFSEIEEPAIRRRLVDLVKALSGKDGE